MKVKLLAISMVATFLAAPVSFAASVEKAGMLNQHGLSVFEWFETDGLISQRRDWLIGFKV